jgi:hypothetical protein
VARFHSQTLGRRDDAGYVPFEILRSEWTCLSTNKVVDPSIVTVHVDFRITR